MCETLSDQSPVRVRFAPSPTGKLHIGGARTAIYNWAFARAHHGTFILRIDDTDPTRSTDENTQIILRAMRWLGLDWDEGPEKGGDFGPYWQTKRLDLYEAAAQKLVDEGKAYYCFCTPEELERARKEAEVRKDRFQGYQRTCRGIDPKEAKARVDAGVPYTIRIKVPDDRGVITVHDIIHGDVEFNASELDDFIIFRSDHTPTYNFATVVDDALMRITHIIRGDDHLSNTPRQIIVYEALGHKVPVFAHLSMILGTDGKKLSKRHGATSVEEYRDQGYDSDAFVNYLALLGWALDGKTTIISRDTLAREFSLDHISKNPATFDPQKLDWVNAQHLQGLSDEAFATQVLIPELVKAGFVAADTTDTTNASATQGLTRPEIDRIYAARPQWYTLLASILRPRTTFAHDVCEKSRFLFAGTTLEFEEKALQKGLYLEGSQTALEAVLKELQALSESNWNFEAINACMLPLPEKLGANKRKFFATIRASICGSLVSPPLAESMELLGKDLCCARLNHALELVCAHEAEDK